MIYIYTFIHTFIYCILGSLQALNFSVFNFNPRLLNEVQCKRMHVTSSILVINCTTQNSVVSCRQPADFTIYINEWSKS